MKQKKAMDNYEKATTRRPLSQLRLGARLFCCPMAWAQLSKKEFEIIEGHLRFSGHCQIPPIFCDFGAWWKWWQAEEGLKEEKYKRLKGTMWPSRRNATDLEPEPEQAVARLLEVPLFAVARSTRTHPTLWFQHLYQIA